MGTSASERGREPERRGYGRLGCEGARYGLAWAYPTSGDGDDDSACVSTPRPRYGLTVYIAISLILSRAPSQFLSHHLPNDRRFQRASCHPRHPTQSPRQPIRPTDSR